MFASSLIKLLPRSDCLFLSRDRAVLISGRGGLICPESDQGLFVEDTRVLLEYRYLIDHEAVKAVALSSLAQHRWLGYYIQSPPEMKIPGQGPPDAAQHTLELMVHRSIGRALREDLQLTNFNQKASSFSFMLKLDADFADQKKLVARPSAAWRVDTGLAEVW